MPPSFSSRGAMARWAWLAAALVCGGAQGQPVEGVDCWVGAVAGAAPTAGEGHRKVDLGRLPQSETERLDIQYGGRHRYQGVTLQQLLEACKPPSSTDLALLHLANGMVVGVPFRDEATVDRLNVFVARRMWVSFGDGSQGWDDSLPSVSKKDTGLEDVRPIVFHGNKLVVSTPWHPWVPRAGSSGFSPWLHVDSLVGIELVDATAYEALFPAGTTEEARRGRRLFGQTCGFCHAVRGLGASFGWDFVDPIALYTHRGPGSLYLHVKYREGIAASKGLMMPAFPEAEPEDVHAVWEWMREAALTGP